jgi:hypothetical protein
VSLHSDDFLAGAMAFWQSRTERELKREDARQIAENLSGFFQVLTEWDAAAKERPQATHDGRQHRNEAIQTAQEQ